MTMRGLAAKRPEYRMSHAEALAFIDQVDAWLVRTGSNWSRLAAAAGVASSTRANVRHRGNGMLRQSRAMLLKVMTDHPDGLPDCQGQARDFLTAEETVAVAAEIADWLHRTGTAPWRLAVAAARDRDSLLRLIEAPTRASPKVAARYRKLMADNPDGMGARRPGPAGARTSLPPPPGPLTDPLEHRRGEADRQRAERHAQLSAEHERKYGRPLGRRIEEMVA